MSGNSTFSITESPVTPTSRSELSLRLFTADYAQYEAQYLNVGKNHKFQLLAGTFNTSDFSYLALPEAYYEKAFYLGESSIFFDYGLGRKKSLSNKLDDIFHLGVLNPYFSMDYINYVPEGQVGLHTSIGNETLRLGANYYPIFIPNQTPLVKEINGRLNGPTPWRPRDPESFIYNGQASPIYYSINYSLADITQHDGYAVSLSTGPELWQNWQIRLSYSHSPINEIGLSRTVRTDLDLKSDVKIYPVVFTSEKMAADILWKHENITYYLSSIFDHPDSSTIAERTTQSLESIAGYGGGLYVELSPVFNAGLNYAHFDGGEITDREEDGRLSPFTIYNSRLLYHEPLSLNINMTAAQILFQINWIYDRVQKGSLLSFKSQYSPWRRMNVTVGFDILGVSQEEPSMKYFLSEHAADDRITGELKYAF